MKDFNVYTFSGSLNCGTVGRILCSVQPYCHSQLCIHKVLIAVFLNREFKHDETFIVDGDVVWDVCAWWKWLASSVGL